MTMLPLTDQTLLPEDWSDITRFHPAPNIDLERMHNYRLSRLRGEMAKRDVAVCILISPVSLRYAVNCSSYALFNSHIPFTYLFLAQNGSHFIHGTFDSAFAGSNIRPVRPISHFYGGDNLSDYAEQFAQDVLQFIEESDAHNKRVAIEYVNPSVTQALEKNGMEIIDGVLISENARQIKSEDEIACIRWAITVAQHGADKIKQALQPGVTELQLWGLLNYTNLANNGDWHDGRMLASGPRINPWLQEATQRQVEAGDLLGFDTDMVGPMGYCADLSRTFFCGPGRPSDRQKELYALAMAEVEHNLALVQAGIDFREFQAKAFVVPDEFREQAYPCLMHGVGMCDEFPHLHQQYRGEPACDGQLETGMVICIESYMGAVGERDGVKLEQQILVTDTGYELLTDYPFDGDLM